MAEIGNLTTIQIAFGTLRLLRGNCERLGIPQPPIVTYAGVRAAGLLSRLLAALDSDSPALPRAV